MGVRFYYINLDFSTARREFMEDQASKHNLLFHRISGVSPQDLTAEELLYFQEKSKKTLPLTKGEIGCCLAHRKALEAFLNSDAEYAVILEDDALLFEGFNEKIDRLTKNSSQIDRNWDVIRLMAPETKKYLFTPLYKIDDIVIKLPARVPMLATALLYNKQGAQKIIDYPACQYSWDTMFRDPYFDYLCISPAITALNSDFKSDIDSVSAEKRATKDLFFEGKFLKHFYYTRLKLGLKAALLIEIKRLLQKVKIF